MLIDYLGRNDWRSAARRWQALLADHHKTLSALSTGRSPDTPDRTLAAARRMLAVAPQVAAEESLARSQRLDQWLNGAGRERIIGRADFEPAAFLEVGLAISRAVCFIEVHDRIGGTLARGTGFLVAPGIVLTNHHVIVNAREAQDARVSFDYRIGPSGQPVEATSFVLDPSRLFVTDRMLDCSFVAIGQRVAGKADLDRYPWLPLIGTEGKLEVGDPVNIIQHPRGEAMQFVLRGNRLLLLPELSELRDPKVFAHYEADTLPGSSGAPVLSRLCELVALHHQAIPAIDEEGNILGLDRKPYYGSDETQVLWLGNEGIRVSALVRFLEGQFANARGSTRDGLQAVLSAQRPDYIGLATASRPESLAKPEGGGPMPPGRIEFTLPLRVSISLDDSQMRLPAGNPAPSPAPAPMPGGGTLRGGSDPAGAADLPANVQQELKNALDVLEGARARPYYDKEADEAAMADYYQGIDFGQDPKRNFQLLNELLTETHKTKPKYQPSRHLYPWVDLHKQGRRLVIKSIYSGQIFDAREFIEEAFRIEARRESLRSTLRLNEAFTDATGALLEEMLEASAPFNCEHVVPQSWFAKKEPMRGDLHHLFACESKCNSFRGNHAYFDFPEEEAVRDLCGRREEDRFEPDAGKGAVARATFYYLVRYPRSIDLGVSQMDSARVKTLLRWHEGDPVSDYERHRNLAIHEAQGNRNPFIDHPSWVGQVALDAGLA